MRLICPNCGAQYEVPDDVIPAAGRDVQCSNCGTTWFQRAAGAEADPVEASAPMAAVQDWSDDAPEDDPASQRFVQSAAQAAPQPVRPAAPQPAPSADPPAFVEAGAAPGLASYDEDTAPLPQQAPALRRKLDPALAELLREEAAREARVRAAEAAQPAPLETQTELGLVPPPEDEATRRNREARERLDRLRGPGAAAAARPDQPAAPQANADTGLAGRGATPVANAALATGSPATAATAATRRELLPDIEEINSTLRVGNERRPAEAADHDLPGDPPPRATEPATGLQAGFMRGFLIPVVLAIGLAVTYAQAPRLSALMPSLAGPLTSYVAQVDGMRLWLDGKAMTLLVWLDDLAGQSGG